MPTSKKDPEVHMSGWDAQLAMLRTVNRAERVVREMQAINWGELTAEAILTQHRPLCWSAIGSRYALDAPGLQELKEQVVALAVGLIQEGQLDPHEVLLEMAAYTWRDPIAEAALTKINETLQPADHRAFCEFLDTMVNALSFELSRPGARRIFMDITRRHLAEADLTHVHMATIVRVVGGGPGLAMLRRLCGCMGQSEMEGFWQNLCDLEAPLTIESHEMAQAAVDMLNTHYGVRSFHNPWDD